jgi:uncharacterized membrane protein YhaH (DUF805 family)
MGFYLSTVGRIPRYQWWLGSLGLVLYAVVAGFTMAATVSHEFGESRDGTIIVVIFQLIALYPYYCITVKRFHDRGKADIFAQLVVAVCRKSLDRNDQEISTALSRFRRRIQPDRDPSRAPALAKFSPVSAGVGRREG